MGETCSPIFSKLTAYQRFLLWGLYHTRDRLEYHKLFKFLTAEREKMRARLAAVVPVLPFRSADCSLQAHKTGLNKLKDMNSADTELYQ